MKNSTKQNTYSYVLILENDTYELAGWVGAEGFSDARIKIRKVYAREIAEWKEIIQISDDHDKWLWEQVK